MVFLVLCWYNIRMEEITLETIEWQAPEYNHKKRGPDFFWAIGLIALVLAIIAAWMTNYVFAIFIIVSGASLIMFTLREPQDMNFTIKTEGLFIGKDRYEWKNIKGFNVKNGDPYGKLLIETSKYFLPVYTIPLPTSITEEVKTELIKIIPNKEIGESPSMAFAEKVGL